MTRKPAITLDGAVAIPPRHQAPADDYTDWPAWPGRTAGPLSLAVTRMPSGQGKLHGSVPGAALGPDEAVLLGWYGHHPGASIAAGYYGVRSRLGSAGHSTAYRSLVRRDLVVIDGDGWDARCQVTPAGMDALARCRSEAWQHRHDLAAHDKYYEHPANGTQRWALACHTGMRLLGFSYLDGEPPEACLLAAWDAMTPVTRGYLIRASMPLLLGLLDIAHNGPLPVEVAAERIREWSVWCGRPRGDHEWRRAAERIRRAADLGLVLAGFDPHPAAGQEAGVLVGPAAGWAMLVPDPASSPALRVVEG